MISLPKLVRKTLAVALMFYFQTRQMKSVHAAALEAAFITGFNEKTIRQYRSDYFNNKGQFSESKSDVPAFSMMKIYDFKLLCMCMRMHTRKVVLT